MANANAAAQEEEIMVLASIYGDQFKPNDDRKGCQITITLADSSAIVVHLHFPDGYPSDCPPLAEFHGRYMADDQAQTMLSKLDELFASGCSRQVPALFVDSAGQAVVYEWIEWIKELPDLAPKLKPTLPATNIAGPEEEEQPDDLTLQPGQLHERAEYEAAHRRFWDSKIVHGEPFTEKKSTFQGHLAPVTRSEDVADVLSRLLQNSKVQRATHNIMAYRIRTEAGGLLQDCDDDGESAAGSRLLHLLQITDAENVVIVVSRWYGGVLLGPARFTHINNAARVLLDQEGYIAKDKTLRRKQSKQ